MRAEIKENTLCFYVEHNLVSDYVQICRDFLIDRLKKESSISEVILDVSPVRSIDIRGINLIIGIVREMEALSKQFKIVQFGEEFQKISNFFRLSKLFTS
ncbi:MAG: STAS domain-containing protein [Desulfobacterales bacterium]|nr:STAS domain-containing protein [Desulfobacterales bacterium]